MSIKDILFFTHKALLSWPKRKLIEALDKLRRKYIALEKQVNEFKEENKKLREEIKYGK